MNDGGLTLLDALFLIALAMILGAAIADDINDAADKVVAACTQEAER